MALTHLILSLIILSSTYALFTSTNCGDLVILCQEPDIDKCCRGACCPLLQQFQTKNALSLTELAETDETETVTPPPFVYTTTPYPKPQICPLMGDKCSSQFKKEYQCCGANTECRFDDYDSYGLTGVCCIEHNKFGCVQDSDCCKYDGMCDDNGVCKRDLSPNNAQSVNELIDAQSVNGMDIDTHERNRSKPNYSLWLSLTANTIILYVVFCILCTVLCCWYQRSAGKKGIMQIRHGRVESQINATHMHQSDLECDIEESDHSLPSISVMSSREM